MPQSTMYLTTHNFVVTVNSHECRQHYTLSEVSRSFTFLVGILISPDDTTFNVEAPPTSMALCPTTCVHACECTLSEIITPQLLSLNAMTFLMRHNNCSIEC